MENRGGNLYLLDTYNQAVHEDVSCTIRTNINTANHHFIFERMNEIKYVGQMSSSQNSRVIDPDGISYAVTNGHKDGEPKIVENTPMIYDDYNSKFPQDQDIIGTITTQIGNPAPRHGFKIVDSAELRCYYEGTAKTLCLNSKVDGKQPSLEHRIYDSEGISTAMTTGFHPNIQEPTFRIRKLTPRECFRLMGVTETDIDKIQQSGVSQSQQYKMAGNSIVVDVLEHIFRKMFVETEQESQQLSLF